MTKTADWKGPASVLLLAILLAGCGIFRRNDFNKKETEIMTQHVQPAEAAGAGRFAAQRMNQVRTILNTARSSADQGQWQDAFSQLEDARMKADEARTHAQSARAKIENLKTEIRQILDESERLIAAAEGSGLDVEASALEAGNQAKRVQLDLERVANEGVQEVADYEEVKKAAQDAMASARNTHMTVLHQQSIELQTQLRTQLQTIEEQLQAEVYAPQMYEHFRELWGSFTDLIGDREYESYLRALEIGKAIESQIPEYRNRVSLNRADRSMEVAETGISGALEEGAGTYALDFLELAQRALTAARIASQAEQHNEAYQLAVQAQNHAATALERVQEESRRKLTALRDEIDLARQEDAPVHAPDLLRQAETRHRNATLALARNEFRSTLEETEEGLQAAGAAVTESRRKKAEMDLNQTARAVDIAEEEGADIYAPDALSQAKDKYAEAEDVYRRGDYQRVHLLAQEARELADELLRILRRTAESYIHTAEIAMSYAQNAEAPRLVSDQFQAGRSTLGEARVELGNRFFRRSIEKAAEAETLFHQAQNEAFRLRAMQAIERATKEKDEAEKAHPAGTLPALFNRTLDALRLAEESFRAGSFKGAYYMAEEAFQRAGRTRLFYIIQADQALKQAGEAGAAQSATDLYQQALAAAASAKSAMNRGDFITANSQAQEARRLATQAERQTWQTRASEVIQRAALEIQDLTQNLADKYSPERLAAARLFSTNANTAQAGGNFYQAYVAGTSALGAVQTTRASLAAEARKEMALLQERSDELARLASDEYGRGRRSELFPFLDQAQNAFRDNQFRVVFERTDQGQTLAQTLKRDIQLNNIQVRLTGVRNQMAQYQQNGMARLIPERHRDLTQRIAQINPQQLVLDYDYAVSVMQDVEDEVRNFPGEADRHLDRILAYTRQTLLEAQQAGARQHIRSEFLRTKNLYEEAVAMPRRDDYFALADVIYTASSEASATLAGTLRSIDESAYKGLIEDYLVEASSFLERWAFGDQRGTGKYPINVLLAAQSSTETDVFRELQGNLSDQEFKRLTEIRYRTILEIVPPPTLRGFHEQVKATFGTLAESADLFNKFGDYNLYGRETRVSFLHEAYDKLRLVRQQLPQIQATLQGVEIKERTFWDHFKPTRGSNPMNYMWATFDR